MNKLMLLCATLFVVAANQVCVAAESDWSKKWLDASNNSERGLTGNQEKLKAFTTLREESKSLSPTDARRRLPVNKLKELYQQTGDYAKLEALLQEDLIDLKENFDERYPVGTCHEMLGRCYVHLGRPEDALAQYQKALDILIPSFGAKHPRVALILHRKALLTQWLGRFVESEALFKRAISAYGHSNDSLLASALRDYAYTLESLNKTVKAAETWKKAYSERERTSQFSW